MRNMKNLFVIILVLLGTVTAQEKEGKVLNLNVDSPSLSNSMFLDPTTQEISIYLPPGYDESDESYPVLYYLPGYSSTLVFYTQWGVFEGFTLQHDMNNLINSGKIKPMIVVIPNGMNLLGGHFFVNSPVTGNWEDYLVKDIISYIDENYRTKPESAFRGVAGHSMGGFSALNLAMLHPDIFGFTYGLSPGLFDEEGLSKHVSLYPDEVVEGYKEFVNSLHKIPADKRLPATISKIANEAMAKNNYDFLFLLAYGAAFSPNPDGDVPFINYPYTIVDGKRETNKEFEYNFKSGFGNLPEKLEKYEDNLRLLKKIYIDYGVNDYYQWIPEGCEYFSKLLKSKNIPHELTSFEGGHGDKVGSRLREMILPKFSEFIK